MINYFLRVVAIEISTHVGRMYVDVTFDGMFDGMLDSHLSSLSLNML